MSVRVNFEVREICIENLSCSKPVLDTILASVALQHKITRTDSSFFYSPYCSYQYCNMSGRVDFEVREICIENLACSRGSRYILGFGYTTAKINGTDRVPN